MWLKRLFSRSTQEVRSTSITKAARHRPTARQLQLEPLEQRRLLTVASLLGDVVHLTGEPGESNEVSISISGSDLVIQDAANSLTATSLDFLQVNANTVSIDLGLVGGAQIDLGAGDDTLTLDSSGGLIALANGIDYDGGAGYDDMALVGTVADAHSYTIGPDPTSGVSELTTGGVTQTVRFQNIEPVVDAVPATTLTVNGTDSDNAINYTQGALVSFGRISIDNFEAIEFANKTNVVINARAGSDTINLNNPSIPTGLASITVNGGDPTAGSDTVIVNGTTGADAITIDQLTDDGARIVGAQPVTVTVDTIEHLSINGRGGADTLTHTTPAGGHIITFEPDLGPEAGKITTRNVGTGNALLPMSFAQVGAFGNIILADAGGVRDDYLHFRGTDTADRIDVSSIGELQVRDLDNNLFKTKTVVANGVGFVRAYGLNGDDAFFIPGNQPFTELQIFGGDPSSGSDVLNFSGSGNALTVDYAASTVTETGFAAVDFTGIETLNVSGGGAPVIVAGTASEDEMTVETVSATTARIQLVGAGPVVNVSGASSTTVNGGAGGVNDAVAFLGTPSTDVMLLTTSAMTTNGLTVNYASSIESIHVRGQGDDDTLTVDVNGTDLIHGQNINYDGGAGSDSLIVQGTPLIPVTSVSYSPGPTADQGRLVYNDGLPMTINFTGLEPVIDLVPAANAIVNGTNADNAINYGPGANPANGLVSVDGFETYEFNNKANLILNGLAGSDTINLNNPTVPGPLASITVNGGDPTGGSDTVVVNGTTGLDNITVDQFTNDGARIVGAQPVTVVVDTTEHLRIVGQNGNDALTVTTPAGGTRIILNDGPLADAASIEMRVFSGDVLLPVDFSALGFAGSLQFADAGAARADELLLNASDPANENAIFQVDALGTVTLTSPSFPLNAGELVPVITTSIDVLRLHGFAGDDTFNLSGIHPFTRIYAHGGDPGSGSDVINFTSAGATTVDLGNSQIDDSATVATPDVVYSGIETLNVNASGQVLTVQGTTVDDTIEVTPYGANAGTLQANGQSPVVNYTNVPANTVNVDPAGGEDELIVNATAADDPGITVNVPTGTIDTGGNGGIVSFTGSTEALTINGLAGDDAFAVTPGAIPVSLNGGDPIAASDTVTIDATGIGPVTFNPGPLADEGSFSFGGAAPVSYVNLEGATVSNTGTLVINGTNANDAITVIGIGPNAADISINNGPTISYTGVTNLTVDGLSGSDNIDIDINALALPTFNVIGGLPSAGSDTVTVTGVAGPLNDNAQWFPAAIDGGTFTAGLQVVNISGIERVVYDGEGGDESLTVFGFAPANRFIHTPGDAGDEGTVSVTDIGLDQSGLGIEYVDLGLQGLINIFGGGPSDILVAFGTASNDVMSVAPGTGNVVLQSNFGNSAASTHVPIQPLTPIQTLILDALDGDDTFNVAGPQGIYVNIRLEGGDPSASDVANLTGDGSPVTFNTGSAVQTVAGGGFGLSPLTLVGIEEVNLDAVQGSITVNGTFGPNNFDVTPTGPNTAQIEVDGVNQVLNTINATPLTINEGNNPDGDTVTVHGTSANDLINVVRGGTTTVAVGGWQQIAVNGANVEALNIAAGQGDDNITISGVGGSPLSIDGGAPTGHTTLLHDSVWVAYTNVGTTIVDPGATPDAGFIMGPTSGEDIAFQGLEVVQLTGVGASTLVVNGTSADDSITQLGNYVAVNDRTVVAFQNFPTLALSALPGDDTISVAPATLAGVTSVQVGGSEPSASDKLIVNGTDGNDSIFFTPTDPDAGSVSFSVPAGVPTIDFTTVESVVINAGASSDDDTLTVVTPAGDDLIVYTPGNTTDSAGVQVNSFVPMRFVNLGLAGTVRIDDSAGGTLDELIYVGTAATDTFEVGSSQRIVLNDQLPLDTTDIENYRLQGLGGDDTFDVWAISGVLITVEGDEPGSGSDVLNFTSQDDTTVDLGNSEIDDNATGASPDVIYSGIEVLNVDADFYALTVLGTDNDDIIEVTPYNGVDDSGSLQANGQAPLVHYRNIEFNTLNVDPVGGEDLLIVNATAAADTVTVDVPGASIDTGANGGIVAFTLVNTEALTVNGHAGDDDFIVTPGSIPVFIDGGNPIAASDTIDIQAGGADTTFVPGPESDEAGIAIVGAETVSYDHIEGLTITAPGVLAIFGTNGDDDITVVGTGTDDFNFAVNDGPMIVVTDATGLEIEAKAGDDDIEIDIDVTNALIAFNVLISGGYGAPGHEPSTDNDTVTVAGVLGDLDNPTWTPTGSDAGDLVLAGTQTLELDAIEALVYDGESDNEHLTVQGSGRFLHTPGTAVDAGSFALTTGNTTMLGIDYQNLGGDGTVTADGTGDDTLGVLGTGTADWLDISFTAANAIDVDLYSAVGEHVDLRSVNIESYDFNSLEGDDYFNIEAPIAADGAFLVFGGGPGAGSDTLHLTGSPGVESVTIAPDSVNSDDQDITGLGATIDVIGIELITYNGVDSADTLTVDPAFGDHNVRVDDAATVPFDRVTSDSLPQIEFGRLATFVVAPSGFGNDVVTFVTRNLTGALAYEAVLNSFDTLVIEGSDGPNDAYLVTLPLAGSVAVADSFGVTVTETSGNLGRLQINTLGGDDLVTVDDTNGLISPPITYDGGRGSDTLLVTGTTEVQQTEYFPGPDVLEGRLTYDLDYLTPNTSDMVIDFINLEPVIDLVPKTVALTVYGTNADNAINYTVGPNSGLSGPLNPLGLTTGIISVDAYETIEFANFTGSDDVVEIISLAGDDVISINSATTPDGLERVWVEGNDPTASDKVIVTATSGDDTITYHPESIDSGRVTVNAFPDIDLRTIEALTIDGISSLGSGDALAIDTFVVDGSQVLTPGSTFDSGTVDFRDGGFATVTAPALTFEGLGETGSLTFTDIGRIDTLIYRGTDLDDAFDVDSAGTVLLNTQIPVLTPGINNLILTGLEGDDTFDVVGDHPFASVTVQGGNPGASDTLNFTSSGGAVTIDLEAQTVTEVSPVIYSGIETINLDAGEVGPTVVATSLDDDITVTVLDNESGRVEVGLAVQQNGQVASNVVAPLINYFNTDGAALEVDLAGGQDTLIVVGNAVEQTFDVDVPAARVSIDDATNGIGNDGIVTFSNNESLAVFGLEGDDTFDVTPGDVPVFIDGGDPIGTTAGDQINIIAGGDPVTFEVGPESDEGGFLVGAHQRVSFDHIEALGVFNAAKAIIYGTTDDDEITVIARDSSTHPGTDGVQDFTTTVNDSVEITWVDTPLLFIDGSSGDDDITLRTPAPNTAQWSVDVFVAGGPASTPEVGDRLRVETPYEDNEAVYQPTAPDSGLMWISNTLGDLHSTIYIGTWDLDHDGDGIVDYFSSPGGVETLLYDGISAEGSFDHNNDTGVTVQNPTDAFTDTLTVLGDGFAQELSNDHFVHTPGSAPDSGSVAMVDLTNDQTMLGISYNNLGLGGTVTVDGQLGADSLAALGTDGSDIVDILFSGPDAIDVDLTTSAGAHVDLLSIAVESYQIRLGAGDDDINLAAPVDASGSFALFGGGPDAGSDTLHVTGTPGVDLVTIAPDSTNSDDQDITGLGATIDVAGIELITYDGVDSADTLTVDPGYGDHRVRVDDAVTVPFDRVTSDTLPQIEFGRLATFEIAPSGFGNDVVTFVTRNLTGAGAYEAVLGQYDTLVIEGADGAADDYTVRLPAVGSVEVADSFGATITETSGGLGRLQINTLGGDDVVVVDVGFNDLISVPIEFDGGGQSDLLVVSGDPATTVDEVIYMPGPALEEGRLMYEDAANEPLMLIDFVNLEPVVDAVPAATLTVLGTNADNAIDYGPGVINPLLHGLVTVDAHESIEFTNKGTLAINALAGDDVVSINNQETPTALTLIEVDGGNPTASDKLVYTGSDAITVTQGAMPYEGTITNAPLPPVNFVNTEHLAVTATGAADILTIEGTDVDERITVDVGNAWGEGAAQVDSGFHTTFTGAERLDVVANDLRSDNLTINGRDAADRFRLAAGGLGTVVWTGTNESAPQPLLLITFGDDVEHLLLETLGGDDMIDIDAAGIAASGLITVTVSGDGPSGSDTLNFLRDAAGAAEVIVELDATPLADLVQEISQAGIPAPVRLLGIETANIDVESGDLYVAGTRMDDVISYTPVSTDSGRFSAQGIATLFQFGNLPEGTSDFVITGGGTGFGGPVGGGFADKVVVNGTAGSDLLTANVVTRNIGLEVLGFGFPPTVVAAWRSVTLDDGTTAFATPGVIEAVTVDGTDGNDTFHVVMRDDGTPAEPVGNGLYVDIQGGSPRASDALVITAFDDVGDPIALPATDFVVVGKSRIPDAGNILVYQSAVRRPHISYDNVEVVSPNVAGGDNLLILGPDMHEENEYRQTASILGTADVINLQNLAIFPNVNEHPGVPADQDWFAVKAEKTGTLDIGISFRTFDPALLPAGGQLGIQVVDASGTVIAGDGTLVGDIVPSGFGQYDGDPDGRVRFPAIAGQTYFFRVFGQTNAVPFVDNGEVVNGYDMTIINEAAPVPYDIELADIIGASTVSPGAVLNSFSVAPSDTLSEVDDFYNGKYIYFLSGNLAGRRAEITDYTAISRTFTLLAGGVSAAPSIGSEILVETHDTGRSQLDDTTRDETPVIRFRLDDANLLYDLPGNTVADSPLDESIRIPFNPDQTRDTSTPGYRVAVFIEGEPQQPDTEPQVPIGYARPIDIDGDGVPDGIYEFDFGADAIDLGDPNGAPTAFPLTDGSHFISAKVQIVDPDDPDNNSQTLDNLTAFGVRSVSHEIVVDTIIPPVWFGDPIVALDGLHPDSDSGIENQPATFVDRITSDTTPSFWGTAEADTIVYVYADLNGNDVLELNVDLLLGKTVAVPNDGTNQYPNGQWNMTTNIDMNDPAYFPVIDGTRTIFAIAEDLAGNIDNPANAQVLDIFVDTRGPQVDGVEITSHPAYDLFDPKPSTDGPTPLVFSLDIDFIDRPNRDAPFIYPAVNEILATADGNIVLVGDYNGVIPIASLTFIDSTLDGTLGTTTVRLNFFDPLPDDRYTLTVSDRITDRAFNALDGESHVQEPQETPMFPSGDGVPGEDFFARFTVDSRPEVAAYAAGSIWADTNGNGFFDPNNLDYTNRDIIYNFGFTSDDLFVGNFSSDGAADGFDKLAAYGRVPELGFRWLVDTTNNGVPDITTVDPLQLNGLPVAGNFDGIGVNGDEVGLYTSGTTGGSVWYFDTDGDFMLNPGSALASDLHGVPFVGDFDGDGFDDLGAWQDDTFSIDLAPWDGSIDVSFRYGFIGVREQPVVADVDQDGYDDLGLWVPDRSGVTPTEGSEWYILVSDGESVLDRIVFNADLGVPAIDFTPVPFGPDLYMQFGDEYAMPLLGNFDPPVASASEGVSTVFQIDGTDGDDEFHFQAGSDGQTWTVTLNGVEQIIPEGTESVLFNGLGGQDIAFLRGSDGDDEFTAGPDGGLLAGPGFSVTTQNVEINHAYGMAGNDVATLHDSVGSDNFKAKLMDDYARMTGNGFYTRAKFFENVSGAFSEGDDDYARVWDTSGDDTLTVSPGFLSQSSTQFHVSIEAFDRLLTYSTFGGADVVDLYDSPGDDIMRARSHKTLFWGPGFDMTLRGWGQIRAHSENGGYDQAKLHDTLGNDLVLTGDDWASLSTIVDDDVDLLYIAYGFDAVKAYHSEGTDRSPSPSAVDFLMLDDEAGWELE